MDVAQAIADAAAWLEWHLAPPDEAATALTRRCINEHPDDTYRDYLDHLISEASAGSRSAHDTLLAIARHSDGTDLPAPLQQYLNRAAASEPPKRKRGRPRTAEATPARDEAIVSAVLMVALRYDVCPTRSAASAGAVSACSVAAEAAGKVRACRMSLTESGVVAIWQRAILAPAYLKLIRELEAAEAKAAATEPSVVQPYPMADIDAPNWLAEVEQQRRIVDFLEEAALADIDES